MPALHLSVVTVLSGKFVDVLISDLIFDKIYHFKSYNNDFSESHCFILIDI